MIERLQSGMPTPSAPPSAPDRSAESGGFDQALSRARESVRVPERGATPATPERPAAAAVPAGDGDSDPAAGPASGVERASPALPATPATPARPASAADPAAPPTAASPATPGTAAAAAKLGAPASAGAPGSTPGGVRASSEGDEPPHAVGADLRAPHERAGDPARAAGDDEEPPLSQAASILDAMQSILAAGQPDGQTDAARTSGATPAAQAGPPGPAEPAAQAAPPGGRAIDAAATLPEGLAADLATTARGAFPGTDPDGHGLPRPAAAGVPAPHGAAAASGPGGPAGATTAEGPKDAGSLALPGGADLLLAEAAAAGEPSPETGAGGDRPQGLPAHADTAVGRGLAFGVDGLQAPVRAAADPAPPSTAVPVRTTLSEPLHSPGFAPQFAGEVDRLLMQGTDSAELLITPRNLGPVRIELSVSGEVASVAFTAAQPETRQAIEQSLPLLRALLAEQGLQLGQTDVRGGRGEAQSQSARAPASDPVVAGGPAATAEAGLPPRPERASRGLVDLFA